MYYIWHKLPPKHRPYKHARGICIIPYVGPYSYGELNYCDRLHILITFIYIITPLLASTHKPVLARAPSSLSYTTILYYYACCPPEMFPNEYSYYLLGVTYFLDFFFILDIFVKLRTAVITPSGEWNLNAT